MALQDLFRKIFSTKKHKPGLVGISVNAQGVALAHVVHNQGSPELVLCQAFEAASDAECQKILNEKVDELGLEGFRCNYVLSQDDYNLLLVEAPKVKADEMAAAMKWRIKDLIDVPVEDVALSMFPVPDEAYKNQNDMVYVVAARKSKISKVVEMVTNSGLVLDVIDIPELAMKNLSEICANDANGLAFMDLRGAGSTMNLCKGGAIYLSRHLNTHVDNGVMETPDWNAVKERLVLEIQRSLDYYESQMGQSRISRLILSPRETDSVALAQELNESMSVQVETLDITDSLKASEELSAGLQQFCAMAIGAALRTEQVAS